MLLYILNSKEVIFDLLANRSAKYSSKPSYVMVNEYVTSVAFQRWSCADRFKIWLERYCVPAALRIALENLQTTLTEGSQSKCCKKLHPVSEPRIVFLSAETARKSGQLRQEFHTVNLTLFT